MKDLEFYRSMTGGVLHTEIMCTGLRSTPVALRLTDRLGGTLTSIADGNELPVDYTNPPYGLATVGDLTVDEAIGHQLRLCRACALEIVLDRAVSEGTCDTLVLFTAQPTDNYDDVGWLDTRASNTEVTDSGRERMRRIAARMGVGIATSNCGPTAAARVPQAAADLLARNLRTFKPVDQTLEPTPGQVAAFWTALNEREATTDEDEMTALLGLVTRIAA